jgi:UDP-N-acetylmuramoyl-tripeptide--D-alanyl-D-alanine ligase
MKSLLKKTLTSILALEARFVLRKYKPRVIAVTGSVGKTSTKDAIHAVISTRYPTRKNEKSFNSEIGVPLTILGCPNGWSSPIVWFYNVLRGARLILTRRSYPEYLVLEVGADHPGDIASITRWMKPYITVLTRMSETPVHVEYFSGPEAVLAEKMELAKALVRGGTLIVNADDELFMHEVGSFAGLTAQAGKKITFGMSREADVRIDEVLLDYTDGVHHLPRGEKVTLSVGGAVSTVEIGGIIGNHLAYPFASAVAVAYALGIETIDWTKVMREYEAPRGRMRLVPGREGSVVIDDSYNSSPVALHEALKTLDEVTTKGRKIAVLGDMKELGTYSKPEHEKAGVQAAHIVHTLVTVGTLARDIADTALRSSLTEDRVKCFDDSVSAATFLKDFVRAGDIVLVKGSQSMRMERVTEALMQEGLKPEDYLVRQEEEWLKR